MNNRLVPVSPDLNNPPQLYVFQRLAAAQKLFYYDDHVLILSVTHSLDAARPGYFCLSYDRNTRHINSHYFKHLGRPFLTYPHALASPDLLPPEKTVLEYIRTELSHVLVHLPPEVLPEEPTLDEMEDAIAGALLETIEKLSLCHDTK